MLTSSFDPRIRAHLAWVSLLSLSACATGAQSELTPLREEVRSLRQARETDRKRLEALELEVDAQQLELRRLHGDPSLASALPKPGRTAGPGDFAGNLPIVHLAPRGANDLPTLPTSVSVREPPAEVVAELQHPPQLEDLKDGAAAPGAGPSDEADGMYKVAFEKLKTGELVSAAAMFQEFARRFPRHPAADNALLDEGIANYGLRRYQDALDAFDSLARRYPAGDAAPEGLWRAGDCELKLSRPSEAAATYKLLMKRFPGSPEAVKAKAELSALERSGSHVAATEGGSP